MTTEKGGRPLTEIDYKTLDKLCAIHCTGEEIAGILNIDYDTLNRRLEEDGNAGFTDYYKKKSATGKMSLRRKQIEVALEGNPTMLIWMGKQHLDQKDAQKLEHSGEMTTFNMNYGGKPEDAND
tara:strand:- start:137 stop:508 length:372 start_codon:yes stop_codon:yes gene_type:complete